MNNITEKPQLHLQNVRRRKFSFIRILVYRYIENKHRLVFDNLYRQNYKIKTKDKPLLIWYKKLCKWNPEFRCYLKYWSEVLDRAYYQKRVNWKTLIILQLLEKIKTDRYAPYDA